MPNNQVANAGVRCRGSTSPNLGGNARCIAIESAVRAAGRIVVWQLAADEVSTAMISSLSATSPKPGRAEHDLAGASKHVVGVVGEEVGAPHRLRRERDDARRSPTRMNVESTPARPGVVFASSHSSLTLVAVSQPQ